VPGKDGGEGGNWPTRVTACIRVHAYRAALSISSVCVCVLTSGILHKRSQTVNMRTGEAMNIHVVHVGVDGTQGPRPQVPEHDHTPRHVINLIKPLALL
jgi:hypothetical protein